MDTRFPPQPTRISLPLYPNLGVKDLVRVLGPNRSKDESLLIQAVADDMTNGESNQVLLCNSGTSALFLLLSFLKHKAETFNRVALPSFSCPQILDAVIAAGLKPVFFDLDMNLAVNLSTIEQLKDLNCHCIIWPNLFGWRYRDPLLLQAIEQAGMTIILDEAQSFPIPNSSVPSTSKYFRILSFGRSKRLASLGGGALIFPDAKHRTLFDEVHLELGMRPSKSTTLGRLLRQEAEIRIRNQHPNIGKFARRCGWLHTYERDVKVLLERRGIQTIDVSSITPACCRLALMSIIVQRELEQKMNERWSLLSQSIMEAFGPSALAPLQSLVGYPTVVAILCPKGKRFSIAKQLAQYGIQSTWYYHPLSSLSHGAEFLSLPIIKSKHLSEGVLVLPFQWRHSDAQLTLLNSTIRELRLSAGSDRSHS